jgi:AKAP7 2'5' RNA ligase-like domain
MHMTLIKKTGAKPKHHLEDKDGNEADNHDAAQSDSHGWFDARGLLKEFRGMDLGTVTLDSVHIMKMGQNKLGKYKSEGAVMLDSEK